jgi:phosphate starvation-inducible PhoH-like protein
MANPNKKTKVQNQIENQGFFNGSTKDAALNILNRTEFKISAKNDNQKKLIEAILNPHIEMIFVAGSAGCGKTFLALTQAIKLVANEKTKYDTINIFKSVASIPNEEIGFLPGSMEEKLSTTLTSYDMQLEKILKADQLSQLKEKKIIRSFPLANIRGLSISESDIVILDEAQNINIETTKTILTRMEAGSKLIVLGDTTQKDTKSYITNGLEFLMEKFTGISDKIETVTFTKDDIVRNELFKIIIQVYEDNNY